ncbi:MAG: hypothetical protein AAGI91_00050 [Bacteroidota bacterium]
MSLQELIEAVRQLPPEQRRQFEVAYERMRSGGDGAEADERSAYDKLKHLIGRAEGPPDLSTNPDYMKGFGEDSLS